MTNNVPVDIRDIKGLVPVPHEWWWLWVAVAVMAIAAVAVWLWKRRKPTAATETAAPPSAFEVALAALQRLRNDNPPVEEFYTRLSDIVRRYLEDQFGLRAPERTTEEFLYEVSSDGTLLPKHKELLGMFLKEADLVKFARFRPGSDDMQRAFAAAEEFVRESQS